MTEITNNLALMIPLVIAQLALSIFALIHVLKHDNYKVGNKPLWAIVVLFISIVGPVCYFIFGKEDN